MGKIKNLLTSGIVNKDVDERLVPSNMMIDAENFIVTSTDGSNAGVGKNVQGNVKKTDYNFTGAKTIGSGTNPSKENVYNLIKGTDFDYVVEYNVESDTSEIVLQSTTGGVLNFKEGERILNVDIISSGEEEGDLIAFSGDSNPPRIVNIATAKTFAIDGFTDDQISVMKPAPFFAPTIVPATVGDNNAVFLEERFVCFGYRWRYKGGYYSAISTWSEYNFTPDNFNVDFDTFENLGMINKFNAVRIFFNTGLIDVESIELLFKESNSENVYVIDKFNKEELNYGDNETKNFLFSTNKIYTILSSEQYFRNYDAVPLRTVAQTLIGNRLAYANYYEQMDLIDVEGNPINLNFTVDYVSEPIGEKTLNNNFSTTEYVSDAGTVDILESTLNIDFTGTIFKESAIISIQFFIESGGVVGRDPEKTTFNETFNYVLESDFIDLADFYTNSNFKDNLETDLSLLFETSTLTLPDDGTLHEFIEFEVTNPNSNTLAIKLPAFVFLIDNGVDPSSYVAEYYSNQIVKSFYSVSGSKSSMHSNREYEGCMIYLDSKGRKTTALVSKTNSVYIPISESVNKNRLVIDVNSNPPADATHYKFGIKQINKLYETIYASIFYEDGVYRWVKLEGSNKNKVTEGDVLIVKSDRNGPLTNVIKIKVLEVTLKEKDFIENNKDITGNLITEQSGFYMKFKPVGININYQTNEFIQSPYTEGKVYVDRPFVYIDLFSIEDTSNPGTYIPYGLTPGDVVTIRMDSYRKGRSDAFYQDSFNVNGIYANFKEWFDTEMSSVVFESNTGENYNVEIVEGTAVRIDVGDVVDYNFTPSNNGRFYFKFEGVHPGNGTQQRGFADGTVSVRDVTGIIIFEKETEDVINTSYFETPETYRIIDNQHEFVQHTLSRTFNCFCFGNGAESYQIKDNFNAKFLNIDFKPTLVSEDIYKKINRFADITYSGVFNSNSGVNRLNEFNLSLANYKDDIEKSYGPIYKIKGQDTNLEVYQEDKPSIVFYGKDLLYNADGTSNLSRIEDVLGQQKTDGGEFGISYHPLSYDDFAFNSYFTDVKRGVVLKRNFNNGLFEISSQGMRSYFKKLFRNNKINHIKGAYDQFRDFYLLNIQYNDTEYVTWVYSDKDNGWLGRLTMNPEDMIKINNDFVAFKNGEVYLCNQDSIYNTFFGEENDSIFSFNFSQEPSLRKNFRNISIEGTDAWEVTLETEQDQGYIRKEDFENKEGVYYGYVRNSNDTIDTSKLSCQGVGIATINGLVLSFNNPIESVISIGDEVRNINLEVVGTIQSKTDNTLGLNTVNNLATGDFVLVTKPQSIENQIMLGYYMKVTMRLRKNTYTEVYSINSEVNQSSE